MPLHLSCQSVYRAHHRYLECSRARSQKAKMVVAPADSHKGEGKQWRPFRLLVFGRRAGKLPMDALRSIWCNRSCLCMRVAKDLSPSEPAVQRKLAFEFYFFFCFLGGVTGRLVFMPLETYFCFFSAGFNIYSRSSAHIASESEVHSAIPEMNTVDSHQHSSSHRRYRIRRNSWVR